MHSQCANVTTSLDSVRQMYNTGHMVIFDGPESFVLHKTSGEVNKIRDTGLNYLLGRWVIPKAEFNQMQAEASGFTRPAR
jgi:hypothetical protein